MQIGLYLHQRSVGVWREVSEDSSSYLFNRPLSLLTHHVHLVGLFNDFDQSMRIEMAFDIHRHHDFAEQMIVTSFERERHVALVERKHSFGYQPTTYDRVDQYVFVSNFRR